MIEDRGADRRFVDSAPDRSIGVGEGRALCESLCIQRHDVVNDQLIDTGRNCLRVDEGDDGHVLVPGRRPQHGDGVGDPVTRVPDPHRFVGHELDVGAAAELLVGERDGAVGRGDDDVSLAQIGIGGRKPGNHLIATQPGQVDSPDVDTRDDTVRVGAGDTDDRGRQDGHGCECAEDEGNCEADNSIDSRPADMESRPRPEPEVRPESRPRLVSQRKLWPGQEIEPRLPRVHGPLDGPLDVGSRRFGLADERRGLGRLRPGRLGLVGWI